MMRAYLIGQLKPAAECERLAAEWYMFLIAKANKVYIYNPHSIVISVLIYSLYEKSIYKHNFKGI